MLAPWQPQFAYRRDGDLGWQLIARRDGFGVSSQVPGGKTWRFGAGTEWKQHGNGKG
jgi:hypothetical protein